MKKPIKLVVQDMYSQACLSSDELQSLRAIPHERKGVSSGEEIKQDRQPVSMTIRLWISGLALSTCIVLSLLVFQPAYLNRTIGSPSGKIDAIVADVVDNHLLHKALIYQANSLSKIHNKFHYLGFSPFASSLSDSQHQLVGAQPCFILKTPAAQLRYVKSPMDNAPGAEEEWLTVFQTRYQREIYGNIPSLQQTEVPLTTVNRGVRVSLWVDSDVLFATAERVVQEM